MSSLMAANVKIPELPPSPAPSAQPAPIVGKPKKARGKMRVSSGQTAK